MFEGIHPLVLPIGFFFGICSITGVTGNFILLLVTIRTKRFRSPCHILIAINCLADLMHETGQFPFVYNVFTQTKVHQYNCFWILFVPLIGANMGAPMILAMGIDRLIAIVFPAKYRLFQEIKYTYVAYQMIFPLCFTVYLMFLAWKTRINDEFECSIPIGLMGGFDMFTYTGYVLYLSIVFLYIFAAYELKKKGGSTRFKAVFISIAITVGGVVFGWLCTTLTNTISFHLPIDEFYKVVMQQYAGITVNMSTASNFFVFYFKNAEYRAAIKRMFGIKNTKDNGAEPSASMTANPAVNTRKSSTMTIGNRASTHSVVAIVQ